MKKLIAIAAILLGTTALAQAKDNTTAGHLTVGFGGSQAGAQGQSGSVSGTGAVSAFGGIAGSMTQGGATQESYGNAGNKTTKNGNQSWAQQGTTGTSGSQTITGSFGHAGAAGGTIAGQQGQSFGQAGGFYFSANGAVTTPANPGNGNGGHNGTDNGNGNDGHNNGNQNGHH